MSATQKISFDFNSEFRAKYVNASGYQITPKGVYACPETLVVESGSIELPIGLVLYIYSTPSGNPLVRTPVGVRVELIDTISVTADHPWICATFTWAESPDNAAVFAAKEWGDIGEDDVIICRVEEVDNVVQAVVDTLAQTLPSYTERAWTVRPHGYITASPSAGKVAVNDLVRIIGGIVVTKAATTLTLGAVPDGDYDERYDAIILRTNGLLEVVSGPETDIFSSASHTFWDNDFNSGLPQGCVIALVKRFGTRAGNDVLASDIVEIEGTQLVDNDLARYIHADLTKYIHTDLTAYIDADLTRYIHADRKNYLLPKNERYLYDPFPVGTVVMFDGTTWKSTVDSGAYANGMPGWTVCDGVTVEGVAIPNMVDRFSKGRANTTSGVSDAGSSVVTLNAAQIPVHGHSMDHDHTFDAARLVVQGGEHRHWMFQNSSGVGRFSLPEYYWNAPATEGAVAERWIESYRMTVLSDTQVEPVIGLTGKEAVAAAWAAKNASPAGAHADHVHTMTTTGNNPVYISSTPTGNYGGGQSFTVLPPWRSFIYVIKYKDTLYPA